jgi:DNA-directed RNA polymerase subunit beta'
LEKTKEIMTFNRGNIQPKTDFRSLTITLASPDSIKERSRGEVTKPETINYRTYKPERDGLFCEKVFGPVKDYECYCGKYKRIRYKGTVCDRCGVEVTEKKVRRERMGHIQLVVPVVHIWYFRSLPNKIGYLLGMSSKNIESIVYYEKYVVIQSGNASQEFTIINEKGEQEIRSYNRLDLLTEEEYLAAMSSPELANNYLLDDKDPTKFIAKMGGESIRDLLTSINLDDLSFALRNQAHTETSRQRKQEALKRLSVVEAFREANTRIENKPEWTVISLLPVVPPELRPLVPLDGGRFASSDLNDLYRRVIIRNNRLKRLVEIKAPEVILRNEKRMLQEAVDSLFDNSRKSNAVKAEGGRALKSISDSLKGKQGRFRQNLLGKRVDYSGRSVIVVGPTLQMHECGLPKDMAAELFKPFIIRKLIERGIVRTVKSAKKLVDRKDAVIWDILENILKGHPILLNRAPTLHRLSIQAFMPKLVEGKAIRLHPLVTTAFNADFDGDQMAVHVPLSNEAILEGQLLMLSSHNILNPQNGTPVTLPSQDMVLGLYYMTNIKRSTPEAPVKGEGRSFYSNEEVIIAYNEGKVDLHAPIKCRVQVEENEELKMKLIETSVGRVIANQFIPSEMGFVNELLSKKALKEIISSIIEKTSVKRTALFLDDIKNLGFTMAFKGGLSFNLEDVLTPEVKDRLVKSAKVQVADINELHQEGHITERERYNQVVDTWEKMDNNITIDLMTRLKKDKQGFNSIYMMLDSGARGSRAQIKQLGGVRGLMNKPKKSGTTGEQDVVENPILSSLKEGLSAWEYFISTHGARKGLADTALKTADAGYLTRRLVDVAQSIVIYDEDCGTLRGIETTALIKEGTVVEKLSERILGRTSLHDIYHPTTDEFILSAGAEITKLIANKIEEAEIEMVEIRSVLTCESSHGVCVRCYGRNLATNRMSEIGDAVGVIAAQSIGEPGTQLTLRTFHTGGIASLSNTVNEVKMRHDGIVRLDGVRFIEAEQNGEIRKIVIGRTGEMRLMNPAEDKVLQSAYIPYGSVLNVVDGEKVTKEMIICSWDAFNNLVIAEYDGVIAYDNIINNVTFKEEVVEQTGNVEKFIIESRNKTIAPGMILAGKSDTVTYNLPVGANLIADDKQKVKAGAILAKIPRFVGKSGDITGGLPRVTELFEARNPLNPAKVAEVDGVVTFGGIKRGNREVVVTPVSGEPRKYLVPLSSQILVQEQDYVRSGTPLSDGNIALDDILRIKGVFAVQSYLVNEVQEVYQRQSVKINDKHIEVIVRQMMSKVLIDDPGDTSFLEGESANKFEFLEENDVIFDKKVVVEAGESENFKAGQIVTIRQVREENSFLKRNDRKLIEVRDAVAATATPLLEGITKTSFGRESWISAASFQETTKVLSLASISARRDNLVGLKENVIVGQPIPAGTGFRKFNQIFVNKRINKDA